MALQRCPECRQQISQRACACPHCGFSFAKADAADYRRQLEQHRLANQALNRQNVKVQLCWLAIFTLVIAGAGWLLN